MIVVTERGDLFEARHWPVRQLCPQMSDEAFLKYAVRNLGVVMISTGYPSTRIHWRAEGMLPAAIAGAVQWLSDQDDQKIVLSRLSGTWFHTLLPSCRSAIISLLDTYALQGRRQTRFFSQRRKLSPYVHRGRFAEAMSYLRDNGGVLHQGRIAHLSERALDGRYVILRVTGDRLFLQEIGPGFLNFDPLLPKRAPGVEIEDQPDLEYGQWIARAYREANAKFEPVIDEVDAEVEVSARQTRRLQYRRLILPAVDTSGNRLLLGTSEVDLSIALAPGT